MPNPIDSFTVNGVAWDSPYTAGTYTLGWTNATGGAWDGGYVVWGSEGSPSALTAIADTTGDGYTDGTNSADIDSSATPLRIVIGLWPLGGDDWDFVSYGADVTSRVMDHLFGLGPVTIRGMTFDDWRASFFHEAPAPGLPQLLVEAAFTGAWTDTDSWTDITNYVRSLNTKRGRSNLFESFQAGTATLVLSNADRRFDPDYIDGPYFTLLNINTPVRITASFGEVSYPVFYGFANEWTQSYATGNRDATCTLTLTDAFKIYQHVDMPGSFYRLFVVGSEVRPTHWYHLTENNNSLGVVPDDGTSPIDAHNKGAQPGSDTLVRYNNEGKSYRFADYSWVELDDNVADLSSGYALVLWFKRQRIGTGSVAECLLSLGASFTGRVQVTMLPDGAGNAGKIQVATNGGSALRSILRYDDNKPHCLVFAYDGDTTETLLIDGVAVDNKTDRTPYGIVPAASAIGRDPGHSLQNFRGSLAEVAIYNTLAADATEIHNAGTNGYPNYPTTAWFGVLNSYATGGALATDLPTGEDGVPCAAGPYVDGSALDYLQALAATEQGECYADREGNITFRTRHYHLLESRTNTAQVRFNDNPDPGDVNYTDVAVNFDDTRLYNYAAVTRQGGEPVIYQDAASVGLYGRWTFKPQGTLLFSRDSQSFSFAQSTVLQSSATQARVESITIAGQQSADAMTNCLAREIGDRVVVIRLPQNTGLAIERELIVEGVEHSYKPSEWKTTYRLSPAVVEDAWILEDAVFGVLDATTALAF